VYLSVCSATSREATKCTRVARGPGSQLTQYNMPELITAVRFIRYGTIRLAERAWHPTMPRYFFRVNKQLYRLATGGATRSCSIGQLTDHITRPDAGLSVF
jgi:hypothetical protein